MGLVGCVVSFVIMVVGFVCLAALMVYYVWCFVYDYFCLSCRSLMCKLWVFCVTVLL